MQVGDSSSQTPWEFNEENGRTQATLDLYREYARLHIRLFPYVWTMAHRAREEGTAVLRPMGLAHPELGKHPEDQYLFGDSLLVAPVLTRGAIERKVLFPEGSWIDWWTDEEVVAPTAGLEQVVAAPLERIPFFVKKGAVISMLEEDIDTLAVATSTNTRSFANRPGRLVFTLYAPDAGFPGKTEVFDGTTAEVKRQSDSLELSFKTGERFNEGVVWQLRGVTKLPSTISLDGSELKPLSAGATEGYQLEGTILKIVVSKGTGQLSLSL